MCRWGCETTNTTFMCKWCGTWFCRECMRGAFPGNMKEELKCRVCNQKKCQGTKVDFLIRQPNSEEGNKGGKSAGSARARSASPSKSAKSAKGGGKAPKSGKKSAGKKGGAKAGKKKKKK